ncbi:MAG: hypothetical protein ACLQVL_33800 [Terriglobia bacterium]
MARAALDGNNSAQQLVAGNGRVVSAQAVAASHELDPGPGARDAGHGICDL